MILLFVHVHQTNINHTFICLHFMHKKCNDCKINVKYAHNGKLILFCNSIVLYLILTIYIENIEIIYFLLLSTIKHRQLCIINMKYCMIRCSRLYTDYPCIFMPLAKHGLWGCELSFFKLYVICIEIFVHNVINRPFAHFRLYSKIIRFYTILFSFVRIIFRQCG